MLAVLAPSDPVECAASVGGILLGQLMSSKWLTDATMVAVATGLIYIGSYLYSLSYCRSLGIPDEFAEATTTGACVAVLVTVVMSLGAWSLFTLLFHFVSWVEWSSSYENELSERHSWKWDLHARVFEQTYAPILNVCVTLFLVAELMILIFTRRTGLLGSLLPFVYLVIAVLACLMFVRSYKRIFTHQARKMIRLKLHQAPALGYQSLAYRAGIIGVNTLSILMFASTAGHSVAEHKSEYLAIDGDVNNGGCFEPQRWIPNSEVRQVQRL